MEQLSLFSIDNAICSIKVEIRRCPSFPIQCRSSEKACSITAVLRVLAEPAVDRGPTLQGLQVGKFLSVPVQFGFIDMALRWYSGPYLFKTGTGSLLRDVTFASIYYRFVLPIQTKTSRYYFTQTSQMGFPTRSSKSHMAAGKTWGLVTTTNKPCKPVGLLAGRVFFYCTHQIKKALLGKTALPAY